MDLKQLMKTVGEQAKLAARQISQTVTASKNQALLNIADEILAQQQQIILENQKDLNLGKEKGLSEALLDRLTLDQATIEAMALGVRQIAVLPDPVGEVSDLKYRPSGIQVGKMRVPLGVIGMIYESRPNVTADAAALCLKSGNAVILRGGSEAFNSNQIIAKCIHQGLQKAGLDRNIVQVLTTSDRKAVNELISMKQFVDVIIPRGGKGLVKLISDKAQVPVIKHLDGIVHVFIDKDADQAKAIDIAINAKTHRYGVCNAMETLLIDSAIAPTILAKLVKEYLAQGVELRGCQQTIKLVENIKAATEQDWQTEYLAPILSIKIVANVDEAIEHIAKYSSNHTESIVTENYSTARKFINEVDSSSVMVNASTRFADGFEYGLGAEIGISTDKIHVRGPVGLEGLTSCKFIVFGQGHVRK